MTRTLTITGASLIVERFDEPDLDRTGDLVIGADGRVGVPTAEPAASAHDTLDAEGGLVTPVSSTRTTTCSSRASAPCRAPGECPCGSGCPRWPPRMPPRASTPPSSARRPAWGWPSRSCAE